MTNLRTSIAKAIALVAVVSASGFAAAADTGTLVATASVSGVCKFVAVPAMAFGAIDPSTVAADVTASSAVTYKCTKGTTAVVTAPASLAMADPGVVGSTLPFSLSIPAGAAGLGFAAGAQTLTISGTVALADAQAALAGTGYTKSVTLTLNP